MHTPPLAKTRLSSHQQKTGRQRLMRNSQLRNVIFSRPHIGMLSVLVARPGETIINWAEGGVEGQVGGSRLLHSRNTAPTHMLAVYANNNAMQKREVTLFHAAIICPLHPDVPNPTIRVPIVPRYLPLPLLPPYLYINTLMYFLRCYSLCLYTIRSQRDMIKLLLLFICLYWPSISSFPSTPSQRVNQHLPVYLR